MDGLRRVLALKSKVFLPYVIPKLTAPPVNTKALAQLASVAGESLNKYLNKILAALLSSFASKLKTPDEEEVSIFHILKSFVFLIGDFYL